jgi:hypothetical protein
MFISRAETQKFPLGVLERLVESKHLTTSEEVEGIYLFQKRLETLEVAHHVDLFENLRTMVSPEREYTYQDVLSTVVKFKERFHHCRHLLRRPHKVDYYLTNDIDKLRDSDPLRVDIAGFDYHKRFKDRIPPDTPKRRAEEALYEWIIEWEGPIKRDEFYELPPSQLLEDDPLILLDIERDHQNTFFLIVTDDIRLVRLAQNKVFGKDIARISIRNWVCIDADEGAVLRALGDRAQVTRIIVDEGSLDAFMLSTDVAPTSIPSWNDDVTLRLPREQEEIWDVYLRPINITPSNVQSIIENRSTIGRTLRRQGARRQRR